MIFCLFEFFYVFYVGVYFWEEFVDVLRGLGRGGVVFLFVDWFLV